MQDRGRNDVLLVIGVIVLVVGIVLLGQTLNLFPPFVLEAMRLAVRATGPLALIILGIIVILIAGRGGIRLPAPAPGARLTRSRTSRMILGVAGGLAEYFGVDPLAVRLVFVAIGLASLWTALLVYIVLAILMPEAPPDVEVREPHD